MRGLVAGRVPRCDGSAQAGAAAEAESGAVDGRADCEAGGVGKEEAGRVRARAGQIEECGGGGGEAYQVEVMGGSLSTLFFLFSMYDLHGVMFWLRILDAWIDGSRQACNWRRRCGGGFRYLPRLGYPPCMYLVWIHIYRVHTSHTIHIPSLPPLLPLSLS